MTFPDFLSASYALLAEEHQRINPLKDLLSVAEDITPRRAAPVRTDGTTVKTSVAQQNAQSMALLTGGMMGVQKKPLMKTGK